VGLGKRILPDPVSYRLYRIIRSIGCFFFREQPLGSLFQQIIPALKTVKQIEGSVIVSLGKGEGEYGESVGGEWGVMSGKRG
jgi:hypothetical protein